jgi:integrase/recombinase XerD
MFSSTLHEQPVIEISQGDFVATIIEAFLIDRWAGELSKNTIKFYREFLNPFLKYCNANALKFVEEITPDFLRRYFLAFAETHNPGGVHAAYRTLRSFFRGLFNEEIMPPQWKNPMLKVKAPKVLIEPIEPISIEDVRALIDICQRGYLIGERDRAIFLFLLDTGARAQEVCNINLEDVEISSDEVIIREGKGRKPRIVFIAGKAMKAIRAYLRTRDNLEVQALFVSKTLERLTYDGLRQILQRRSKLAGLKKEPTLHDFRRQFALSMLNNGADIFSLQRLMGHKDISILRRYLAQTTGDIRVAHDKGSPVANYSWS